MHPLFVPLLALGALASPLSKRQDSPPPSTDSTATQSTSNETAGVINPDLKVVKFAALAESLEATFYESALSRFSALHFEQVGFVNGQIIVDQLKVIQEDEKTHLTVLQTVAKSLGGDTADVDSCQFDFDSVLQDVPTFLATARVLEYIGIDAYIGGTTLINDKSLLVNAAEITTVEARHNTVLNTFNGGSAVANAFDMVLSPQQVLSLAAPFVKGGCDPAKALGLTPTPALSVTNTEKIQVGTKLTFAGAVEGQDNTDLFCNMIVGGASEAVSFPIGECAVPDGIDGAVHISIVKGSKPLGTNIVTQDASTIVAGPALIFVDTVQNLESQLLLGQHQNASNQNQVIAPGNQTMGNGKPSVSVTQAEGNKVVIEINVKSS